MVINCFCFFVFVFVFLLRNFLFSLFETLNRTRRLPLGESREILFLLLLLLLLKLKSLLCRQGSLSVKSEPSSFASSPRLRKISGLAVPPSTPFPQQQASCGLIGPSTSRHSKWRADSYRFREFFPSTLDCMFQTKTGEHVPASLPHWFLLTLVGQNMWI